MGEVNPFPFEAILTRTSEAVSSLGPAEDCELSSNEVDMYLSEHEAGNLWKHVDHQLRLAYGVPYRAKVKFEESGEFVVTGVATGEEAMEEKKYQLDVQGEKGRGER